MKNFMAYYPYWADKYPYKNIPFEKLTHLFHAFVRQTPEGGLTIDKNFVKPGLIQKAHEKGCKVILSLGGGAMWSSGLDTLSAKKETRQAYVELVAQFCAKHGYDGVDVDWEFPQSAEDMKNHALLIKDFRERLGGGALVTMAIAGTEFKNMFIDFPAIDKYVDFYNLMFYDSHGPWSPHAGHNAPVYLGQDTCPYNCEEMLAYMNSALGLKNEKMCLGVPFYGYLYRNLTSFYGQAGDCTGEHVLYRDIPAMIGKGWVKKYDEACMVPYLVKEKGKGILTYDDPESIILKAKWAESKGLLGIFTWEITQDLMKDGSQPMLEAMLSEGKR